MQMGPFQTILLAALCVTLATGAHAAAQNIDVYPQSGVQGVPITGYIGSFTASESNPMASSFIATVDWGDGFVDSATIAESAFPGLFTVSATHTYRAFGDYDLFIYMYDFADNTSSNSGRVITIQPAPITATGLYFTSTPNVAFNKVIATFVDENPYVAFADFSIAISWGDGSLETSQSALTQIGSSNGYQVSGSHLYQSAGLKTVTVKVTDGNSHNSSTSISYTGDRVFADGFDPSGANG